MRLSALLDDLTQSGLPARRLDGEGDPEIRSVTQDTREIGDAALLVAVKGLTVDSHEMLGDVRGASALLVQRDVPRPPGVPAAIVDNTRRGFALAAAALECHPTASMTMVGITGTDGKTTSTILTMEALRAAGARAGGMSSLDFRCLDEVTENVTYMTTLEAPQIQAGMRRLADAGVDIAVLETTSHGIALERVAGVDFDVAAYTNLTHEHLDFHRDMDDYRRTKLRLADLALGAPRKPGVGKAVVYNADEPAWETLASSRADRVVTYGVAAAADLRATDVRPTTSGITFRLAGAGDGLEVRLPLTGTFNVLNALCALSICHALDLPLDRAAQGLATARGLRGRMQVVDEGQPFTVIVDFAHTPDGLAKVVAELRPLTPGRLLVVFGAPGDRDPSKRPLMGRAVAEVADRFTITTDDPRHERVEDICMAIAEGARAAGREEGADFTIVHDRRQAITEALAGASAGDTVLLAGKGHEDRMLVGGERLPWDEVTEARRALAAAGHSRGARPA